MKDKYLFSWIHLSDIHANNINQEKTADQLLILDSLKEDMILFEEQGIPRPEAVFVTGDIAFSGSALSDHEYSIVDTWLNNIMSTFSLSKESIFIIPGNHDIQRNIIQSNKNAMRLLESLRSGKENLGDALKDENDSRLLELCLNNFNEFAKSYNSTSQGRHFHVTRKHIPENIIIRIVGLNTSLLSIDDTDYGKLQISNCQINEAFVSSPIQPNEIVIVLTHHPFEWLCDAKVAFEWVRKYAHIHLYGHMHDTDNTRSILGNGSDIIQIRAGAVYDQSLTSRVFAYGAGAICLKNDGTIAVRHWPRMWSQKNCEFRSDVNNCPINRSFSEQSLPFTLESKGGTVSSETGRAHKSYLARYKNNLESYLSNNLLLEIYDEFNLNKICITPYVISKDKGEDDSFIEFNHLLEKDEIAVIGEPGSGKTTALRKLALDLLHEKDHSYIPIYISLASFNLDFAEKSSYAFLDYINSELKTLGCPSIELLQKSFSGKIVLLLDGWDEVYYEKAHLRIKEFLTEYNFKFIITGRPESQKSLPFSCRFEMFPLSQERIREFIQLRIQNKKKVNGLLNWLSRTPSMAKLAENPLNLSIMAIVFKSEKHEGKLTKTKLYERAFETIIRQHHRQHPYDGILSSNEDQTLQIEQMLQNIAYETMVKGEGRFFTDRQLNQAAVTVFGNVPAGLKTLLTGRLGIIRNRKAGKMEFFHVWYQEFLAARKIIEKDGEILEELNNEKLKNVLPYIIGLTNDRKQSCTILKEVKICDPFNYCRAILEGMFTEDEIDELLNRIISFGEHKKPKIPIRVELAQALSGAGLIAISSLFRILQNEQLNDYTRRAALEALAILPADKNKFENVIVGLLNTRSQGLLWHLIEHVGRRKISKAIGDLKKYLHHDDPIVAGDAIWAISQIQNEEHVELPERYIQKLFDCMEFSDKHVQGHALRTLGRLKVKNAMLKLSEHLSNRDAGYRWIVPESAALIGGEGALDVISDALDDTDERVVAAALKGILMLNAVISDDVLEKIYKSTDDYTWIPSVESSLSSIAKNTYNIMVNKNNITLDNKIGRIFICRHCTTSYNIEHKLQGVLDIPLSGEGRVQAQNNTEIIRDLGVDVIIASPLKRARETGEIYANSLRIPLEINPKLIEIDHGAWQGEKIEILKNNLSVKYQQWLKNPLSVEIPKGTENISQIFNRITEAIKEIAIMSSGRTVLIITHKHVRAVLQCFLLGQELTNFRHNIDDSIEPEEIMNWQVLRLLKAKDNMSFANHLK